MLSKTHLLAAVVVGLFILEFFTIPNPIIFFAIFCFASILPDIDSPHSKIGRKAGIISNLLNLMFGHRGFLHSIWVPLGLLGIGWYYNYLTLGIAAMSGYILHLIVDAMTIGGVRFFGPFGRKTRGFFKTGGIVEFGIFWLLLALLFWKIKNYLSF